MARQRRIRTRRLEVWLPGSAVSVNAAYSRSRHGVYLTSAARAWKRYVAEVITYEAIAAGFPICETLRAATISYTLHKPRGDADNAAKLLFDGIAAGLGVNDKIFSLGGAVRVWAGNGDRPGVRLVIEATAVAGETEGAA